MAARIADQVWIPRKLMPFPSSVHSAARDLAPLLQLSRHAFIYVFSTGLQRGTTILIMPLLLARLTVEDYGRYGLLLSLYVLVPAFVSLGLNSAIDRFYFETNEPARRCQITSTLLISHAASILLITTALDLFLGVVVNTISDVGYHPYVRLTLWAAAAMALFEGVVAFWRAAERPVAVAIAQISSFVITTGVIAFFLFRHELGLRGVFLGLLLGQGAVSAIVFALAISEVRIAWDGRILKEALAFSLPLIPHIVASWILRASDRWILEHYHGTGELGTYFLSYQLASAISLVMFSANYAIAPRFLASYRDGGAEGARSFHRRIFPLYCWSAVALASGLILVGPALARLLSRGKVPNVPMLTAIIATAIVASALYVPFANALFALKATARLTMLTMTCGILNISLNLLFVPAFGGLGVAVAMLVSYVVLVGLIVNLAHRQLGLDRHGLHFASATVVLMLVIWIFGG